jgi:hypothetical protein
MNPPPFRLISQRKILSFTFASHPLRNGPLTKVNSPEVSLVASVRIYVGRTKPQSEKPENCYDRWKTAELFPFPPLKFSS